MVPYCRCDAWPPQKSTIMQLQVIQNKIYELRGQKVIFDFDLAELYQVDTKVFNQAVKRNMDRFPRDFMFRLTAKEWKLMRSQFVTASSNILSPGLSSAQIKRNITAIPYVFSEHGVTMLASVLRSDRAIKMNIAIVRAFVAMREYTKYYKELSDQLSEIRQRMGEHDVQLNNIYDAIENLLDQKQEEKTWSDRDPIGFKK
jgi:hypothetical protein